MFHGPTLQAGDPPSRTPAIFNLFEDALQGWLAMFYGIRDVGQVVQTGGFRDVSLEPVVLEAIADMVKDAGNATRALTQGEDVGRAMLRFTGSGSRLLGVPFWTLKNYITGARDLFSDD